MRSMSFLVNDRSTGGLAPAVAVTIIENGDGSLSFSLNVLGPYTGDLRGFFFDVADESLIRTLTVAPTSAGFTEFRQGNDTIKDLGNGANMQGLLGSDGGYDAGIEIGNAGTGKGKDDYQSFSFKLTSSAGPLTLEDFSNVDFGLRLNSVGWVGGKRNDKVKMLEHTSSAIDARDDANALTEDQGPNQVGGNVFDNDVNLGAARLVVAVNGSVGNVGDEVQGTYGTLRLNLNGSYTYTLDNTKAQALAAGQEATETFSYTAKKFDELTSLSSDSANLTITITGTNDGPVIAGNTAGDVFEDGPRSASGQLVAVDPDLGDSFTWSVDNPGTLTNPSYRFLIDNFRIARHGDQFYFNDTFGDGVPPPSGPGIPGELAPSQPFPPNAPANYTLNGTFQESGGRVILDGARSVEVEGIGNPNPRFATSARLLSNNSNDPADLNRGLKIDDHFTVEGRFDLLVALDAGDNYGIRLTDSGGGVTGSDLLQVVVRKAAAGNLEVALVELDGPSNTSTTLGEIPLAPLAGENQIVLRLDHDPANAGVVRASFDLLGGAAPRSFSFSETGRIFGTGTPETGDDELWTRAEFRAAADGVMQNGVYGTLSVNTNGEWNYELNNASANVQALAQGEHATDTFTVRVTDAHGATDTETVTIDVVGTNDVPIITGGSSGGGVAEDTPSQTATGQLSYFDADGDAVRWSAGPTTLVPTGPNTVQFFGYTADFHFTLDRLTIERNNDGIIFDDTFSDGVAPPSAPNFANGTPANYIGTFGLVEAGGRLHLDGARSLALRGVGNDALSAGQLPVLATNIDSNDLTRGLKSDDNFTVAGTFDLVVPGAGQAYGISLTDNAGGGLPPDQLGDDGLTLLVRSDGGGGLIVQLNQFDVVADASTTLAERAFAPVAGQNQITLRLAHDVANLGVVRAEFDLLGAGDPQTFGLSRTGRIFGTDTPGYAGDDENWTRAQIVAFGPDTYGESTTYRGTYGSLTVEQDGRWTYTLDNSAANVQALPGILAPGQLLPQDVISVRVVDEDGTSNFRPVFITVAGTNDTPDITGGVTTGLVYEDGGARVASGQLSAVDVDHGAVLSWTTLGAPTYGFASVDATGRWTYTLDNSRFVTQQLGQSEIVTDTFTVRATDEQGAFDAGSEQLVSVEIRGTNDRPNLPPTPLALAASEDGGAASAATAAFDIDNGSLLHWSLNRGSAFGYFSPYEFRAESFSIVKNSALLFHDEFNAGGPPPSAPDFLLPPPPGGSSATSYFVNGAFVETGGKLVFRGSDAIGFRGTGIDSLIAGNEAILNTNIDPANTVSGLKKNHQFVVEAVFDLVEPALVRQQYGIQLTDGFGQIADDLATLFVRREADGLTYVRLADNNSVLDTASLIAREQLVAGGADQIRLRLSHAADADTVSGSYELLTGGVITGGGTLGQLGIFGTDTAFPGDDNNWIRPGLIANALDTGEFVQTLNGAYGTLGVSTPIVNSSAQLAYTPDSSNPAVQALAQGESVVDSFFVRAVDQFGMTSAQRVDVSVHGANDPVVITSGAQSGTVKEDADATPSPDDSTTAAGTISFSDVDLRDSHSAFFAPAPTNTTALGTFLLGSVNEAPNAADGFVAWTYVLDNAAAQFLGEGETRTESYLVSVRDNIGDSATQTVTVTIHGTGDANQPPLAQPAFFSTDEDVVVAGTLSATDSDLDTLTFSLAGMPSHGSAVVNSDGSFVYTPAEDYGGSDSFQFRVADGQGGEDIETVTLGITPVADTPVLTVPEGGSGAESAQFEITHDASGGEFEFAPRLTALNDGGFIATWYAHDFDAGGDSWDLFAQRLDAAGQGQGIFQVSAHDAGELQHDQQQAVALLENGNLIFVWRNLAGATFDQEIVGRVFDLNGTALTPEFIIDTIDSGSSEPALPEVAAHGDGFVVTWARHDIPNSVSSQIFGRAYDSWGTATTERFDINPSSTPSSSFELHSPVATLTDDSYVVLFRPSGAISGQRYDASHSPVGASFVVASGGNVDWPDVAALPDGGFVASWTDFGSGIFARRFAADGSASGTTVVVSSDAGSFQQAVAAAADGGFAVAWRKLDADNWDTVVQRFDPDGAPLGGVEKLNTSATSSQFVTYQQGPDIAALQGGNFAVAWHGDSVFQGRSQNNIFGSVLGSDVGGLVTNEDVPVGLQISAALNDMDGSETLTLAIAGVPQGASLSAGFDSGGIWTLTADQLPGLMLTPAANSHDDITLTVTATATEGANGDQASVTQSFTITVNPVNDAPVAVDDVVPMQVSEDEIATINVLGNDLDVDGDAIRVTAHDGFSFHGARITLNGDGTFRYDPTHAPELQGLNAGETRVDTFTYGITDEIANSFSATVSITVAGMNETANTPPQAVADTNGLDAVIESGFAPGAPFGDPFASGNVLLNDSDPDPNFVLHVSALNDAPIFGTGFATGTYGALQINPDGNWSYTLHDSDPDTNALAQGEAAFDQFTYTVSDQQGASASTTLSIAISGTNDFPTLEPVGNTGDVTEDGQSVTGGQLVGSDPDHGTVLTFGLLFQPTNVHTADYLFGIDDFTVTRFRPGIDTAPVQILNDDFGNGVPPPNGFFVNGNAAYFSSGVFAEAGGRALMNGDLAQGTFSFGGPLTVGHTTVATTNTSTDETQGLRGSHDFDVMGRFDAELPQRAGQAYGIALTDQGPGFGGDDHIQLLVRRDDDGVVRVVLREGDSASNSVTLIDSIALGAITDGDQIVLHLTHDDAQRGTIVGSFELFHGTEIVQSRTFAGTGQVFGTETPGTSDDETFTRAMFFSTSPAQTFSRTGTYGTLVLEETGAWQYFLDNADPDTQALGEGQTAVDSFDALAIDQFRTASIRPIQVTVHGTNDVVVGSPPDITGGDTTGVAYEDSTASVARGQLTAVDADPGTILNWSVAAPGAYGGAFVDASGRWTYSLNNTLPAVQQLAQGGATLTDTFTVRAADQNGASDTQAVTVTLNGTNDRPILLPNPQSPPPISIVATEDGGPVGAQAQGSDTDVGALLRWSLSRQGASGYFSDYEFRADSFSIEKNFAPLFRDEFNAGGPPPSAPDFIPLPPPGGSSLASYVTSGGFQENPAGDGTLIINGANAAAFRGPGFNGLSVGSEAILATNVDPANTVSGLKKNHQFVVDGVFDLVQPELARQAYGITLTDAVNQVSDDQLSLVVRHDPDGQVYVQFNNASGILDTSQIVARTLLPLGTAADQIRLRFSHDANSGDIVASYQLLDEGAEIGIGGTLGQAGIFGTDTPLFAGDDENWIRTGLFGNGVDLNEGIFPNGGVQTLAGQFGTLSVGASGELTYNVDNTNLAVQALNQGQSVVDSFFVRVTDQFGLSASQRVEVTVNGVDEPLNAPPVAAPDNNDFDAVIEAGIGSFGLLSAGDPTASGNVILGSFGVGLDTDPDGDTLLVTAVSVGGMAAQLGLPIVLTYGSLVINEDGNWTYTLDNSDPDTNALRQTQPVFNEPAFEQLVTYTVSDGQGGTDSAELTIRVSGANDAPIVATDTNSVTEHALDQPVSVMGNVLTNDRDPEGSALQIFGPLGTPTQGTYGTLTLQSNGDYVYTTDPARVNFLDAGEVAHDIFTNRYAVSEVFDPLSPGQAIVNATRLEIAITGTAEAPSNADASVFEDGQRKASGEVDLGGGTIGQVGGTGPMTPWSEYRFRIDNLTITKNGAQFFNDGFDAGGPPPQAPGSNYFTTGTFTETGGRANMDGSLAGSIAAGFAGHTATLNTDTTADLTSGLKQNHAFVLQARFDLVLPDEELETYGIRLTDAIPGGGGDDIVEISVRRQDGNVVVALREANVPGNPPAVLTSIPLVPAASDNRIDLRLEHIAGSDEVMASFNLINGDVVGARIDLGAGHIFGNETWTRAQFLSFSPSMPQNGKYGTLSVEADGDWTYSLRNGIADVQALAQGEAVTDVFTVQVNDVLGPRTETVAIDVVGTNDNPNPIIGFNTFFQGTPPAFNGTYVVEGSAPQTSRGSGFGNDLDHSRPVDWSVTANPTPAAASGTPLPAYRSDYAVKATQLNVTKDGLNILTDTFNPATPALGSDPNFTYITNAPISESGGAFMNGQQAGSLGGVGTSELLAGHSAVLDTNISAASPGRGLKSHNDFKVDARFDYDHLLSLNPGQVVGVSLTDRAVGELPPDQLGDDILTLLVTRDATGFLVQFDERDAVSDSITALGSARLDYTPAAGRQIVLHLEHDKDGANFGRVQASFDLFDGATLLQDGVFAEHLGRADRIFGAETPGNPYDDEVWTRVQLLASGRDGAATQTTAQGRFGDLTVDNDGGWTYTLNAGDPDTLGLAHGQVVADSFNWRATDAYGGSTSRTFNVNVIGTDPAAPGGDKTGTAGNDVLVGSGHAEKLTGGTGSDLLIGLGGSDTFDFNNINEGNDTISDFTPGVGGDVLDFRGLTSYVPGGASFVFNFVQLQQFQTTADGAMSTTVAVDPDGMNFDYVPLATLQGVSGLQLEQMIADGNLLLG